MTTETCGAPRPALRALPAGRLDAAAAVLLVLMWSSGFVGAELGTRYAPADTLLAWRYLLAAVVLVAVWAGTRRARLTAAGVARQGVIGLLSQALYLGGIVGGVGFGVPPGTAALIAAVQPMLVAALAGPVLGERTSARQRWGLGLGILGVALVVAGDIDSGSATDSGGAPGWAFLLPVGGMLALSAGTLLERRWRSPEPLLESLTIHTVAAAALLVAAAGAAGHLQPPAETGFWAAVAWVVVLSGFGGYGSYLLVLRRGGATRVSTLLYLTPPTTLVWAFLMFGLAPGPLAVPGVAVCAVAVWLVMAPAGTASRMASRLSR